MSINLWAILTAALASFLFGAAYYGLLGRTWMKARGWTEADGAASGAKRPPLAALLISFGAELVMALVLSGVLAHVAKYGVTVRAGVMTGAICWLGFVATTIATNNAYGRARLSLTLIDSGHWLGVLLLQGLVLGLFG